jgi:formate C-acetyltransferase
VLCVGDDGRQADAVLGARVNLAKTLLYAINGGRDEKSGVQVALPTAPVTGNYLDYDDVLARLDVEMDWLARVYVDALNVIHYMHDKYAHERIEMALHDHPAGRTMAMGIAGLAVTADSLSAIRDARVKVVRDDTGLVVDYDVGGNYPAYGNNDDRADDIAVDLVKKFMSKIRQHPTYRGAITPSRCSRSPRTWSTARQRGTPRTADARASPSPPARTR